MIDIGLIETLTESDRSSIPERKVFAKGAGAMGYFRAYMPMGDYTKAAFLSNTEQTTPVFVRFSKMNGSRGSADTTRDMRGFAARFYTEEGNYDLLSVSFPVFFIRDPEKYPELIKAMGPDPKTNIRNQDSFWTFVAENPESMPAVTWLYSNRGTLKSYRTMETAGVHTYIWENEAKEKRFVRCRWKPVGGSKNIDQHEAEFLAGFDPDVASRDLYETFDNDRTVEFELLVQMADEEDLMRVSFNLFDPIRPWPEAEFPVMRVGKLTLNQGPDDYFEQVERAAFSPGNTVPGILLSSHPLLQAEALYCTSSNKHRLGVNYNRIEVNRPKKGAKTKSCRKTWKPKGQDPIARMDEEFGSNDEIIDLRLAGSMIKAMGSREREALLKAVSEDLMFVDEKIQLKVLQHFRKASPEMAVALAEKLLLEL